MIKNFPISTKTLPWKPIAEAIPYTNEEEAIKGAAKILKGLGCKIAWMKNGEPEETKFIDPSNPSICVFDPANKIGVLILGALLTDEEGSPFPMNQELGPHHL